MLYLILHFTVIPLTTILK